MAMLGFSLLLPGGRGQGRLWAPLARFLQTLERSQGAMKVIPDPQSLLSGLLGERMPM